MKMSDVFNTRKAGCYGNILCEVGEDDLGVLNTPQMAEAAAHAINQHDKLVQINKELVEALDKMHQLNVKMIRDFNGRVEPWNQLDEEHLYDSGALLDKAKELLND